LGPAKGRTRKKNGMKNTKPRPGCVSWKGVTVVRLVKKRTPIFAQNKKVGGLEEKQDTWLVCEKGGGGQRPSREQHTGTPGWGAYTRDVFAQSLMRKTKNSLGDREIPTT